MATKGYRKDREDDEQQDSREMFKCRASGCGYRATIFIGAHGVKDNAHGLCRWHYDSRVQGKDDYDVSKRLRDRQSMISALEAHTNARLKPTDDGIRAYDIVYPEAFAPEPGEHHHAWLERLEHKILAGAVSAANPAAERGY